MGGCRKSKEKANAKRRWKGERKVSGSDPHAIVTSAIMEKCGPGKGKHGWVDRQ